MPFLIRPVELKGVGCGYVLLLDSGVPDTPGVVLL